jgi:tetratricopeptide (TPR) repeat protein
MGRRLLVLLVALLVAVQVVRNAAAAQFAERSPATAARIWPGHPSAELSLAMTRIGDATRLRRQVPESVFAEVRDAALKAPLEPEPFLVRGVQAQLAGDAPLALQAFAAAERRDPRSLPAHYFLADALFRAGDSRRGLQEVGTLARLAPNGLTTVGPYIAAYAKDPENWPQLRELFRGNPQMETAALVGLANDATNADAVLALARDTRGAAAAAWLPVLVNSLVAAGQYDKARAVWARGAQVDDRQALVHDAGFTDARSPPPFNWALMSSTVGLAERQSGGRLHIIFYGHDDGLLARQLLLLGPGNYRMTMTVAGNAADARALTWSVRCYSSQTPLAGVPLDVLASRGWAFTIPSGCAAQWLELSGVSSDLSRQTEVVIGKLNLVATVRDG